METADEWVVIIPPMNSDDAKRLFCQWKANQLERGHLIDDEQIRIDHLLGPNGCHEVRYCFVRSESLQRNNSGK